MSGFVNLRALNETETVAVTAPTTESDEFQIPSWAQRIGAKIPATVGKGSIELQVAESTGGTFSPVLEVTALKKAKADGGYFEIGDHVGAASPDWV